MIILDKDTINSWIDMISKVYVNLHNSQRVLNSSSLSDKRRERIIKYFNRLEEVHNKVSETKSEAGEKLLKNFYYDLYVIKPENITESYFNNQIELARERGYGNIILSDKDKEIMIKQVIDDQKETLDKWIEYFLYDEESKSYEMWEKYWVFQGLQTLGKYDKETYKFSKRDKTTVYPFPPVEREYIFTTLKLMEDFLKDKKTEDEIKNALEPGNFKLLYEYVIKQSMLRGEKQSSSTSGKWIKYEQGSDYNILRNSLQGYYTGWCTAAGENFAREQLANGDFYVYYTLDDNGEAKVPRIAIRMDGSTKIGEIRGIADNQNMEPEMMPILEEKIKEFPDRDKYYKKEHDMKLLTLIDKKVNKNIELNLDELKFLYEMDNEIEGFGYEKDPRIQEIINKRNQKKDYALIYNINENEIALTQEEWKENPKQYKILINDLKLDYVTSSKELILPNIISGSLCLNKLISSEELILPKIIGKNLELKGLTNASGLLLPDIVGGSMQLNSLISAKDLKFPKKINKDLDLSCLFDAENIILPEKIGGKLNLSCLLLTKGIAFPKIIDDNLDLSSLSYAAGLELPEKIGGILDLSSISDLAGLVLPKTLGGPLCLNSITYVYSFIFPKYMKGSLDLHSLINADELILPQIMDDDLYLNSLVSVKGIIFPNTIRGNLNLNGLESAKRLILPQIVEGWICLNSLKSSKGLKLPYGFDLNYLMCPDNVKNEILANPDKYFMEPPINEEKIKKLK